MHRFKTDGDLPPLEQEITMSTSSRLAMTLLALTIAAPVMAQPATTTAPSTTTSPSSTMAPAVPAVPKAATSDARSTAVAPKADAVDINSATAAELKMLPGVSDSDSTKIIQGRPYTDKNQLVSKKAVSEATYDKIKDHVVAKQPKS
jgi:competence protein ComEA